MGWLTDIRAKQKGKKVCVNCKHFDLETNDWESAFWEAPTCDKNYNITENENWNIKTRYYRCFEATTPKTKG